MIETPTVESVTAQGGIFLGTFSWPPSTEEGAIIDAFVCPGDQLEYEYHVPGKKEIIVYSLPHPQTLARHNGPQVWIKGYATPRRARAKSLGMDQEKSKARTEAHASNLIPE